MFFKNSILVHFEAAVKGSLAAEGKKNAARLFFDNNLFNEVRIDRQKIDFVGEVLGGLDGGYVGVDKNYFYALLF